MIPPIFQKPQNLSELKTKFAPELNSLKEIVANNTKESFQHFSDIATSKDEFKKAAAKEIVELMNNGPSKSLENVDKVSDVLKSGAKKTLETMKESENPIIKETAQKAEESTIFNPEEVINSVTKVVKETIEKVDSVGREMEKEIIKEVVKTKVKKGFFDNKFFNFFKNIFAKLKTFFNNLLKVNN